MWFLVHETISVVIDPDDADVDDEVEGDSSAEDERAEMVQRTINNRALGLNSIAKLLSLALTLNL